MRNPRFPSIAPIVAALMLFSSIGAFAQSAEEIVKSSRDRIQADSVSTRSRMVIIAKDGSSSERLIDQYSAKIDGVNKTVVIFQKPASVANTRFLTVESAGKAEDRWIFLPSLGKVRRISSGEGSASFMGTDLSYDDVSSANRAASADSHRILREEKLDGKDCWVVESKPKTQEYQYSKILSWVEKSTRIAFRIELYDRKGELAKILDILDVQDRQGRFTPLATRMSTVKAKTSTTIYVEIIKYDDPIPAGVFTTKFLETGRP
ncbi:MAG: hypothetical protein FD137_686 [Spirochaetes bacterium]|nr:MAG: hypothetical protein FD137_686 [Spirochaetota bacterium]